MNTERYFGLVYRNTIKKLDILLECNLHNVTIAVLIGW